MIRVIPGPAEGEYTLVLDHRATTLLVDLLEGEINRVERRGKNASVYNLESQNTFTELQVAIRRAWRDAELLGPGNDVPVQ
jgi:hypothetical protein